MKTKEELEHEIQVRNIQHTKPNGLIEFWYEFDYDKYGNVTAYKQGTGWERWERNEFGGAVFHEHSDGYWSKRSYNKNGYMTYYSNSKGETCTIEYDKDDNIIKINSNNTFMPMPKKEKQIAI